jgi:hypothetical protein
MVLVRHIEDAEIAALDTTLRRRTKANELGSRLETISSVGPAIASALGSWVTAAALFEDDRHLSVACRGGRLIRIGLANNIRSSSDGVAQRLAWLLQ